jgi:cytochrome c553
MIRVHVSTTLGALLIAAALAFPANAQGIEAKLQLCSACHGDSGVPINAMTPIIWGQTEYFIVKQLHDFKSGDRDSPIMVPMAQTLTQADLRPAARYFAGKTWPARTTPAASAPMPEGMAVCQICHQPGFVGALPAPRLAGQSYEYLVEQMRKFAEGERTNNADMVKLMEPLSAQQRDAMARYIAGL